jgi:hypothetical protein
MLGKLTAGDAHTHAMTRESVKGFRETVGIVALGLIETALHRVENGGAIEGGPAGHFLQDRSPVVSLIAHIHKLPVVCSRPVMGLTVLAPLQ